MFRCGKYKKRAIVAEGVAITAKTVQRAEKKEETKEVVKDEAELQKARQLLFQKWRTF